MIVTDGNGKPFEKPRREDYLTDWSYLLAFYDYKDRITADANRAFDEAFRKEMKAGR